MDVDQIPAQKPEYGSERVHEQLPANTAAMQSDVSGQAISAQDICTDISALMKYFKMHMADMAEVNGLTTIQLYALNAMSKQGSSMGKLAQTLQCDASNVTGIVDRLSALDLITRKENPLDRRVKTLQLTAKGEQILTTITGELPGRLNCTSLTAAERMTLHQLILKLAPTIQTNTGK